MGPVVDPLARRGDPFPGRDRGRMPDDRYQITVAARLGPQDTEAVLGIVERYPLDQAGKHFLRCLLSLLSR